MGEGGKVSRRAFIRGAGLAAAGLLLAGLGGAESCEPVVVYLPVVSQEVLAAWGWGEWGAFQWG